MSMYPDSQARRVELEYGTGSRVVFNFFNAVYAWMAVGLAVTAVTAYGVSQTPAIMNVVYGSKGMLTLVGLLAFGIAWGVQGAAMRISAAAGTLLFMVYAVLVGTLISGIFLIYSNSTLVAAFLMTAGTFGTMSVWGYVTKRDLSRVGSILVMLAFGFIIASFVNIWVASDALGWVVTYGVLVVFVGLVAYETQMLREFAEQHGDNPDMAGRMAIVGSLMLYVAFINIFLSILRILGSRD